MNGSEEVVIDLSNVPIKPMGKREIQQLEIALVIATLYSPEVLELIRDPIERATWVDSLAVAAAALAREKAGLTVSQIAEEIGRSETSIRAHLSGKTKAGKLIRDTYEKLKEGRLRVVVPFVKAEKEHVAGSITDYKRIEELKLKYENEIKSLRNRINKLEKEASELREKLRERDRVIALSKEIVSSMKDKLEELVELYKEA